MVTSKLSSHKARERLHATSDGDMLVAASELLYDTGTLTQT